MTRQSTSSRNNHALIAAVDRPASAHEGHAVLVEDEAIDFGAFGHLRTITRGTDIVSQVARR